MVVSSQRHCERGEAIHNCEDWIASSLPLLAMTGGKRLDHFATGDAGGDRPARRSVSGQSALSPRVPVAISSDPASRIATVSVTATSTTGVFIVARSRCRSPRLVAQELRMAWKNDLW